MDVTPKRKSLPLIFAALFLLQTPVFAQNAFSSSAELPDAPEPQNTSPAPPKPAPTTPPQSQEVTLSGLPKRFLFDQKEIWTSPLRLQPKDAIWLVPYATATGLLISSDQHTMTKALHINSSDQSKASTLSNGALVGIGAIPAGAFLWSSFNRTPQAREMSILAGEALADSMVVNEALKLTLRRERPLINNAAGDFFKSSWNDGSFPSNHSIAAWSMASVIASEYPGWLTRTAVYGLASTVSVSRVLSYQHFPSDVLVGSVTGWLIGRYVYHAHHNYSLNPYESPPLPDNYIAHTTPAQSTTPTAATPSAATTTALPAPAPPRHYAQLPPDPIPNRPSLPFDADPDTIGSTNVPMDSWIYPALERLAALGLIPTQNVAIRPWTRQECLRQLHQAQEIADRVGNQAGFVREARRLMTDLDHELSRESTSYQELALESVYARYGTIAGPALYDSFHFGQTWWNDFGRPLGRGSSAIVGFSTRAHYGRLFFYVREELQHSPGNPAQSPEINQLINQLDRFPPGGDGDPMIAPIPARAAYNRVRPIEMYGGISFGGNALSFGKQVLYWGPNTTGPFSFSSNAEPTYNLRFVSTRPHPLPLVPSLGTYRVDFVLGKLSGHSYPARPWFNGQKFAFNFGDNLEMSFTRWSIFLGEGHPITLESFKRNIFSATSTGSYGPGGVSLYGDRNDPGDRKAGFDFRYKLPFVSRLVTVYADAYTDDDPSPLAAPRRAAWSPGIYFARLPYLSHMDMTVEAISSTGLAHDYGGLMYFINNQYLDGNTNKGFLLGNAVGRDARAIEARTKYWFSSKTTVEGGYRQTKIGTAFLPGGGTITDGFIKYRYAFSDHWLAEIFVQQERFLIPSYMNGSQHNTSGWLQLTWNPQLSLRH